MDNSTVLLSLQKIVREVLDLDDLVLTAETTAEEVEDWDSIMHVEIIVETENHFDVKFKTMEIENFKTVGDIANCIISKL